MKQILVENFSLKHSVESGQFFAYTEKGGGYQLVTQDYLFYIEQEGNILYYENISEDKLRDFFALDFDILQLKKDPEDELIVKVIEEYWGMRILNQDLWQCMVGFICSAAANIPKIKMNINLLCEAFGEKVEDGYLFPKPGSLDDYDKILKCKTGYRAKYLFELNKIILENPNLLDEIKEMNYQDAHKELTKLPGIGPKVADCICLFSLGHEEAFPIDTWIKKIIEEVYLDGKKSTIKQVDEFIKGYFKHNSGIKQQYLFHYFRNK